MLDDNLRAQLKQYLERLSRSVEITAYTDDGDHSKEMLSFLGELKSASDKISVNSGTDSGTNTNCHSYSFAYSNPYAHSSTYLKAYAN